MEASKVVESARVSVVSAREKMVEAVEELSAKASQMDAFLWTQSVEWKESDKGQEVVMLWASLCEAIESAGNTIKELDMFLSDEW